MQQSDWKVSHGGGCAHAGPFALLGRNDVRVVQYVAQWPLAGLESARQLNNRVFPNLGPERCQLTLTEQTKVESGCQANHEVAVVAPAKRAEV